MAKTRTRTRTRYIRMRGGRRRNKFTLPLAIIGGFYPTALGIWNRRTDQKQLMDFLSGGFTGWQADGSFDLNRMRGVALPIIGGFLVHWLAGRFGWNRAISRAGIPVVRI